MAPARCDIGDIEIVRIEHRRVDRDISQSSPKLRRNPKIEQFTDQELGAQARKNPYNRPITEKTTGRIQWPLCFGSWGMGVTGDALEVA